MRCEKAGGFRGRVLERRQSAAAVPTASGTNGPTRPDPDTSEAASIRG